MATTSSVTSTSTNPNSISSQIDTLVAQFTQQETNDKVVPLQNNQKNYQNLSNGYDTLSQKLTDLQSTVNTMQQTGSNSIFADKIATSSNKDFVTATATSAASASGYQIRVNQLAKSDVVVSQDQTISTASTLTGTQTFDIAAGGGTAGQLISHVTVTFGASETNQTAMQKIASAINSNQAVVNSSAKTDSTSYAGGPSTFTVNLNGTSTDISVNGGSTYGALMDEIVTNITQKIPGLTVQKLTNTPSAGQDQLQLIVKNTSDYISITPKSGFDVATDLGIGVTNLVGASGIVNASVFSPTSTTTQLSLTATKTGLDYRVENLSDTNGGTSLASVGLNLGTTRPTFSQSSEPNTPGFIYPDTTTTGNQLNSFFSFNGLNIQRNSNSVSDLANGVTFNLNAVMQSTDTTANISVQPDVDTITSNINDFITKFNAVYTNIKTNSVSDSSERGIFVGDANAQTLLQTLTSLTYTQVAGISTGNLSYLSQIGISFDTTNGLSVSDQNELKNQLTGSPDQVGAIFNSASGIATRIYNEITPYLGAGGYLAKSKAIFQDDIQSLSDRITNEKSQIDDEAQTLRNQYVQLQVAMSQLSSTYSMFGVGNTSNSLFG